LLANSIAEHHAAVKAGTPPAAFYFCAENKQEKFGENFGGWK
jgi:YHS domain-containing protein